MKKKTLDHIYMNKSLPYPPFGKSDHNSILLIPAYKQRFKQEAPVTRSIKKWSDETDAKLQDCFSSISDGIQEYTTVTGFINKCIDGVVPSVTVHTPTRSHGLQATSALS